jgi:hypothetical protein
MLQTVPETKGDYGIDQNIDIFDGFGNAGMGAPSSLPVHFNDKRIEEINSIPTPGSDNGQHPRDRDTTPFTSPAIIQSPMEFPGMAEYNSFPDMSSGLNNHSQGHGHRHGPIPGMPPPLRQNSGSNFHAVIPRSVPEFSGLPSWDGRSHG